MIKVSIIGATGYTGAELVRILHRHEQVRLEFLSSKSYVGREFSDIYPTFNGHIGKKCAEGDFSKIVAESDVVFVALPHGHSVAAVKEAVAQGKKVVDLGADFRLDDVAVYESWYKVVHGDKKLLSQGVYGLPEINREAICNAQIIGNPGCYPTGAILGLAPALKSHILDLDSIIIDAKSGVSGAGRTLSLTSHFAEVNENTSAYGVANHRHAPEIEQELGKIAGKEVKVTFTPHLVPMTRGILSTIYASLKGTWTIDQVRKMYEEFYKAEPFVHLLPEGRWPHTKWVAGSNNCHLNFTIDERTGRIIIVSAIDNLVKGASGQAIQNMNLLFGLPETTALKMPGIYP